MRNVDDKTVIYFLALLDFLDFFPPLFLDPLDLPPFLTLLRDLPPLNGLPADAEEYGAKPSPTDDGTGMADESDSGTTDDGADILYTIRIYSRMYIFLSERALIE